MSEQFIDRAKPVRDGEELDAEALEAYLREHLEGYQPPLEVEQFPAGYSNLTYLLRTDGGDEYVLRRPPFGAQVKSGHDMNREYTVLSHLIDAYPRVPRPLLYCEDETVIGASFYVMERVKGVILRAEPPPELGLGEEVMEALSAALVDNLAAIHAVDPEEAGLGDFGKPEGYVERQVEGWIGRYEKSQTDDIPAMDELGRWMRAHQPGEAGAAIIHNDYKHDNLVLDPEDLTHIRAVLDWEMATVGCPLMDLGSSLGYWVEPDDPEELKALSFGPTMRPGSYNRRQLVDRYSEQTGRDVPDALFYYVYGLYKLAVIIQQIYYRYKHGYTQDERFATLIMGVYILAQQAALAIEKDRIERLTVK